MVEVTGEDGLVSGRGKKMITIIGFDEVIREIHAIYHRKNTLDKKCINTYALNNVK